MTLQMRNQQVAEGENEMTGQDQDKVVVVMRVGMAP